MHDLLYVNLGQLARSLLGSLARPSQNPWGCASISTQVSPVAVTSHMVVDVKALTCWQVKQRSTNAAISLFMPFHQKDFFKS